MKLAGQVAFITGASSGIGRAIALTFAGEGADCALVARGPAVAEVAAEIEALGRRALPLRADVAEPEQVEAAVAAAERELGPIGLLVNSAGGTPPGGWTRRPLWETEIEEWDEFVRSTCARSSWSRARCCGRACWSGGAGGSSRSVRLPAGGRRMWLPTPPPSTASAA